MLCLCQKFSAIRALKCWIGANEHRQLARLEGRVDLQSSLALIELLGARILMKLRHIHNSGKAYLMVLVAFQSDA